MKNGHESSVIAISEITFETREERNENEHTEFSTFAEKRKVISEISTAFST